MFIGRTKRKITNSIQESESFKKNVSFKRDSLLNLFQDDSKDNIDNSGYIEIVKHDRKQLSQQESFLKKITSTHKQSHTKPNFGKQYYDIKNSQSVGVMKNKFYVLEQHGDYFFQKTQKSINQLNREKQQQHQQIAQTQDQIKLKPREKRQSDVAEEKLNQSETNMSNLMNLKSLRLNETIFSQQDKINTKLRPLGQIVKQDFNPNAIDQDLIAVRYTQQLKTALDLSTNLLNDHYSYDYDQLNDKKNFEYGLKGFKKFHLHYKKLDKILQKDKLYDDNQSGITQMMQRQENYGNFPSKFGVLNENAQNGVVDLRHQLYGDKQIEALSCLTQQNQNVTKFDLCQNRLTQQGADQFFKHLTPSVQYLNLSKNKIGKLGSFNIRKVLVSQQYQLIDLNIEANHLMDENIMVLVFNQIILSGIQQNKTLKRINLSENYISDQCCNLLSDIIFHIQQLQEFYLRWNFITHKGSSLLFNQLQDNKNIMVFDISFNQLSGEVNQIVDFIKHNNTIIHLDLSYNKFTLNESFLIQEALNYNKSIYGFHYIGNTGHIDSNGFLILNDQEQIQNQYQHNPIKSINPNKQCKNPINDYDLKNICWICDEWREYQFKIQFNEDLKHPLFVHFQFDGFKSRYMGKSLEKKIYIQYFMIPNVQFLYFYTSNFKVVLNPKIQIQQAAKKKNLFIEEISKFNVQIVQFYNKLFDIQPYKIKIQQKPRTLPKEVNNNEDKLAVQWSFNNSMFKYLKMETDELLNKCFELDYSQTKITKLTKSTQHQVELKEFLKQNYKLIKDSYKFYASMYPIGDVWCIQQQQLPYIIKDLQFQGEKILEIDINMKFQQCLIANKPGIRGMPEKGLVRIIEQKYMRQGSCQNMVKATQQFFSQYGSFTFKKYDNIKWRQKFLYTKESQIILQTYRKVLSDIFVMMNQSKKPVFITLDDAQEIIKKLGLRDKDIDERDVNLFYNQSKLLEVDEIHSMKVFQLNFNEFQEFLVRIAQKCSIQPFGFTPVLEFSFYSKLEAICQNFFQNFLTIEARQSYKLPETSILLTLES